MKKVLLILLIVGLLSCSPVKSEEDDGLSVNWFIQLEKFYFCKNRALAYYHENTTDKGREEAKFIFLQCYEPFTKV